MDTNSKFFDDFSKVMSSAMGVAQGAKTEAENTFNAWVDRWLAQRDLVTREEFDALKAMAQKARDENAQLAQRIAALEVKAAPKKRAKAKKATAKKEV